MKPRAIKTILLAFPLALAAHAHVGSPDIYLDSNAGPYRLFVTLRPPQVIPGIAELQVRSETAGIDQIRAVPIPMKGPGAKLPPVPDKLKRSPQDVQFFTGSLWIMTQGSWRVQLNATGQQGEGVISVPVPAVALTTLNMQGVLGAMLAVLGIFLAVGLIAIVGAGAREAKLEPGAISGPRQTRRGRIAMTIASIIVIVSVWGGNLWWNREAANYSKKVYKPLEMSALVDSSGTLTLRMQDPGWLRKAAFPVRDTDDLIPDHDHLMHLYAIRQPALDIVYHLHPEPASPGVFQLKLPSMPAGTYRLYADIVHASGFPETLVSTIQLPQPLNGRALSGDDATAAAPPWQQASTTNTTFLLPDGYRMTWLRGNNELQAKEPAAFRFQLLDPKGHSPTDMQLYMGMLGHAAFVKTDGTVFAHIHPTGSVSMAAFMLAQNQTPTHDNMPEMNMAEMNMPASLPNEVAFPYGFPTPGRYRIFVQMKHGTTIETGVFDATVR